MPRKNTIIRRQHIGRPIDFKSSQPDEQPINGQIEAVRNGVATVRFYAVRALDGTQRAFCRDGFVAYIPVTSSRILEVY